MICLSLKIHCLVRDSLEPNNQLNVAEDENEAGRL